MNTKAIKVSQNYVKKNKSFTTNHQERNFINRKFFIDKVMSTSIERSKV